MSKKLNKYIATFDYFDKIVLSVTSEAISIISFTSVIRIHSCRNSKCNFQFKIFFDYRNNKEII